jgi:hypothetical protein
MFRITQDIIDEGMLSGKYFGVTTFNITDDIVKVTGSERIADSDAIKAFDAEEHVEFRLRDDDGIIYHYGEMLKRQLDGDMEKEHIMGEEAPFEPLDSFGNAFGCTSMEYLENGEWKRL